MPPERDWASESLQASNDLFASAFLKHLPVEPAKWMVTKKARRDNSNRFDSIYQFERCTQSARSTKRAQFFDNVCKSLRTVELPVVEDFGDFDVQAIKGLWAAFLDTLERSCQLEAAATQANADSDTEGAWLAGRNCTDVELAAGAIDAMYAALACSWRIGGTAISMVPNLPPFDPDQEGLITTQAGYNLLEWSHEALGTAVGGEEVAPSQHSARLAKLALCRLNRVLFTLSAHAMPTSLTKDVVPAQFLEALAYFRSPEAGPLPQWMDAIDIAMKKETVQWLPSDWPGPPSKSETLQTRSAAHTHIEPMEIEPVVAMAQHTGDPANRPKRAPRPTHRSQEIFGFSPPRRSPSPGTNIDPERDLDAEAVDKAKMLRAMAGARGLPVDGVSWSVSMKWRKKGNRRVDSLYAFQRGPLRAKTNQFTGLFQETEMLLRTGSPLDLIGVALVEPLLEQLPGPPPPAPDYLASSWIEFTEIISGLGVPPSPGATESEDPYAPSYGAGAHRGGTAMVESLLVDAVYAAIAYVWRSDDDAPLNEELFLHPGRGDATEIVDDYSSETGRRIARMQATNDQRSRALSQAQLLIPWAEGFIQTAVGGGAAPERERSGAMAGIALARLSSALIGLARKPPIAPATAELSLFPRQLVDVIDWYRSDESYAVPDNLTDAAWAATNQGQDVKLLPTPLERKAGGSTRVGGSSGAGGGGGGGHKRAAGGHAGGAPASKSARRGGESRAHRPAGGSRLAPVGHRAIAMAAEGLLALESDGELTMGGNGGGGGGRAGEDDGDSNLLARAINMLQMVHSRRAEVTLQAHQSLQQYKERIHELEDENSSLQGQLMQLVDASAALQEENAQLKTQVERLVSDIKQLQQGSSGGASAAQQHSQALQLHQMNQQLQAEKLALQRQLQQLTAAGQGSGGGAAMEGDPGSMAHMKALQAKNDELRRQNETLGRANEQLMGVITHNAAAPSNNHPLAAAAAPVPVALAAVPVAAAPPTVAPVPPKAEPGLGGIAPLGMPAGMAAAGEGANGHTAAAAAAPQGLAPMAQ